MYKLKVKAVIFDMDGVITNTMPDHFRAWREIFSQEGIHVSHMDVYVREGQPGKNTVKELFKTYNKPYSEKIAKNILDRKEKLFKDIVKTRYIIGSRSFLKYLKKEGFVLALVTGTSRHEAHRILPQYLWDLFSVSVTGDEVYYGKPEPEPYLKALDKLKMIPREAVVIENAPFGIQSAKAAGLKCLALETSLSEKYLKSADFIFQSFKELRCKVDFVN